MDSKDERMDIYDSEKHRTGRVVPRSSFLQAGEYMLYVLALIERPSDGRFLITQRALTKKWAAGAWEVSGGGALAGGDGGSAGQRWTCAARCTWPTRSWTLCGFRKHSRRRKASSRHDAQLLGGTCLWSRPGSFAGVGMFRDIFRHHAYRK